MAEDLYAQCFPPSQVPDGPCDLNRDDILQQPGENNVFCAEEEKKRRRNQSIVLAEKQRRKTMTHLYSTLQSLIPFSTNTNIKVARDCLIEEACKYINQLRNEVQRSEKKKKKLLSGKKLNPTLHMNSEDAVSVGVDIYSNDELVIRITASRMPRCLSKIYEEVEAHGVDIQSADVYKGHSFVFLYFHTKVNCTVERGLKQIVGKPSRRASLESLY